MARAAREAARERQAASAPCCQTAGRGGGTVRRERSVFVIPAVALDSDEVARKAGAIGPAVVFCRLQHVTGAQKRSGTLK